MVFGGDCIAKINGKTVFIPFSLPNETLEVEIVKQNRDYDTARIVNIIKPSPFRREPFCPLFKTCGGCTLQHCQDEEQSRLRAQMLKSAFEREGLEVPEIEIVSGKARNYRARFQFHDGGLMKSQSAEVVSLNSCPCATEEVNRYLSEVSPESRPRGRVHVFGSSCITSIPQGYDKIVIAEERKKREPFPQKKTERRTVNGRPLPKQKQIKKQWQGSSLEAQSPCTVEINGRKISFDVQGFFQSNMEVLSKTLPLVCEGLKGSSVLDMYSGCGTFSVFLADNFQSLTLVEHNRDALVYAEQNLLNTRHQSFGVSGSVWVKYHAEAFVRQNGMFDAAVIDPPRSGMEKDVCKWLCSSGIPNIRSLSCDAATHARDAAYLVKAGYRIEKLFLLDFYPQTSHIESLAYFKREPL